MKKTLIIRMEVQDEHGHVIKEISGQIENFDSRPSVISDVSRWVSETICSLRVSMMGK